MYSIEDKQGDKCENGVKTKPIYKPAVDFFYFFLLCRPSLYRICRYPELH